MTDVDHPQSVLVCRLELQVEQAVIDPLVSGFLRMEPSLPKAWALYTRAFSRRNTDGGSRSMPRSCVAARWVTTLVGPRSRTMPASVLDKITNRT